MRSYDPPKNLSLDTGIKLIKSMKMSLSEEAKRNIKDIMTARNLFYLKHVYERVSKQTQELFQGETGSPPPPPLKRVPFGALTYAHFN